MLLTLIMSITLLTKGFKKEEIFSIKVNLKKLNIKMTLTANQQMKVAEQKIIIEQLRKELQYEPIYTSIAIKELISYVETNRRPLQRLFQ